MEIQHYMKSVQNIKLAVDAIVFGYENKELYILLIKQKHTPFNGQWALPGGLVKDDEPIQNAVHRELKEETGITVDYLEQLYTFGDQVDRDPRNRVVSVAYFALVNPNKLILRADTDAEDAKWFVLRNMPKLAFDHEKIVQVAKQRLQSKLHYEPIGFDLLRAEFPFSDLEHLYKTILERDIDRRNFRKKILSLELVEETDKIHKPEAGRPSKLFKFNKNKYNKLKSSNFHLDIKLA